MSSSEKSSEATRPPLLKVMDKVKAKQAGHKADALEGYPTRLRPHAPGTLLMGSILLCVLAFALISIIAMLMPEAEKSEPPKLIPAVEVERLTVGPLRLHVRTQGTVRANRRSTLSAEVAGRVVATSPAIEAGGIFRKGDILIELDPTNYEAALAQAEANHVKATADLQREEAEAEQARKDWARMGRGKASPLAVREPQLAQARAAMKSAESALHKATVDLQRTKITAPYDGRTVRQHVDIGQYVNPGTQLAEIFSTDYVEVRLPIAASELQNLDFTMAFDQNGIVQNPPGIELSTELGNQTYYWQGRIERTEGVVDERTRLFYLVGRVDDPYGLDTNSPRGGGAADLRPTEAAAPARRDRSAPLLIGMFVHAKIEGREVDNVARIPRAALREGDIIWIVKDGRITSRKVNVVASEPHHVVIRGEIKDGETLCLTPLSIATENMQVSPRKAEPHGTRQAEDSDTTAPTDSTNTRTETTQVEAAPSEG